MQHNMQDNKINIESIPNIIYIGNVVANDNKSKNKWKINYLCNRDIQIKPNGRIYLIVVNSEIYKIGSSACKGGIKTTFSFYQGGLGGSPSIRTFGIHKLIQLELDKGNKIEIYTLFNEEIKIMTNGLFSSIEKITFPDIREMEDLCRQDYKKVYGKYPCWNFQENGEEWAQFIKDEYAQQVINRGKPEEKNIDELEENINTSE